MIYNSANLIATAMDATLNDPEFQSIFSPVSVLEKVAFTKVSDEDKPTELEIEFAAQTEQELTAQAGDEVKADCVACGKKRANWDTSMGVCKCAGQGCSPISGCEENCSCGCKTKQAEVMMDNFVKSAFDNLMKASTDLEEAGFGTLSANALILVGDLITEAKAKKNSKEDKAKEKAKADKEKAKAKADKEKAKEKADKEKEKAKTEKDKNDARSKMMKEKEKADKEKAKEKAEKAKEKSKK